MKFLCLDCDQRMVFQERDVPGDGTFAAAFTCPACGRRVALLANPMETQLVQALGVKVGGRTLEERPLELVRGTMLGRDDAFLEAEQQTSAAPPASPAAAATAAPRWSVEAQERLSRVPNFVRGMIKKIYGEYARERGIAEITPTVMDQARRDLGLEGM